MSKIIDDVKTGLKGVQGAGDTIRGTVMGAADQALDSNSNHPQTQASRAQNASIAQKGKQDVQAVDDMLARREREHEGVKATHPGHRVDPSTRAL
ncbi:hypothetical protein F5Y15DRAFT_369553 [Xylariaceae sp. FL0016]|nr:hypothetical protein F5Y15DRAFT_369553 [Xylariaceae sp. FL0016]